MVTPLLVPEADDLATVAEALAIIDAYDGCTSGSDSTGTPVPENSSFNFEGGVEESVKAADSSSEEQPKPQRKRRSKNPAGYSTRLLHRKKAEMQQLREEALLLEAKVEQLKRTRAVGVGALEAHASQLKEKAQFRWMELASIELQRRQQSEVTNRRLRALLANQRGADNSVGVVQGMEFLFEKPPTARSALDAMDNSSVIMAELEKKASEMYLGSRGLFEEQSSTTTVRCEMRRRVDEKLGQVVEIVSSAPLSCSVEASSGSLWKELTTIRATPNVMEKSFDQILRGSAGATAVNGLQVMKRFVETDRIVLAQAYRMLLPTGGLHLRGHTWTIFSRSETDPTGSCQVRAFVQLYVEIQPGFSSSPEDTACNSAEGRGRKRYQNDLKRLRGMASRSTIEDGHGVILMRCFKVSQRPPSGRKMIARTHNDGSMDPYRYVQSTMINTAKNGHIEVVQMILG
ncbi:unnamed protein product [Phytophthora fragariaefolia]|uniref:Unnamed protein product n=1 Tax=Phytophthora fragariaefolia TaxID=1490495 RepID=A0A9W6XN83_9STRA|nr:unnamed protein product [Phytophthora fragariaefolia]